MQFEIYQICENSEGWQPIPIHSATEIGKRYTVLVNPWRTPSEYVCDCKGYTYRGQCHHQMEAHQKVCQWEEGVGDIEQTEEQRRAKICPACGAPTKHVIEVQER